VFNYRAYTTAERLAGTIQSTGCTGRRFRSGRTGRGLYLSLYRESKQFLAVQYLPGCSGGFCLVHNDEAYGDADFPAMDEMAGGNLPGSFNSMLYLPPCDLASKLICIQRYVYILLHLFRHIPGRHGQQQFEG
jgi:hypothetical protein